MINPPKKIEVAIADDHSLMRNALAKLINTFEGYSVIMEADNGKDLRAKIMKHVIPDIVLLDVNMPEMDGFETASLIRQRDKSRHTPIIFLTALGRSEEALFKGYDIGAVDYLVKPILPSILKSKVAVFVQLKRQSELLEAKNIELNATIEELEAFSYTVAHDLRAPLARIDGFSQALLEFQNDKLDDEGKRYLQRVRTSAQRMCGLVDELMSLSRVTRAEMRRERVDLSALALSVGADLKQRDLSREMELTVQPDLWASGDAGLLYSALFNLLENAWKFTSKRPSARVEFGAIEKNGTPVYFVRDDGAGFDMACSQRLFQAFQRLHAASEYAGSGIGLATVARIVKRHGGRLWAESGIGRGATFYFSLSPEK